MEIHFLLDIFNGNCRLLNNTIGYIHFTPQIVGYSNEHQAGRGDPENSVFARLVLAVRDMIRIQACR